MSDLQTFYRNKPYFFVPMSNTVDRAATSDRRQAVTDGYGGALQVTLTTITPLIFGEGDLDIVGKSSQLVHSLARENGVIALPGSSFKGMLRSFFECVTKSCVPFSPRTPEGRTSMLSPDGQHDRCNIKQDKAVCPSCSVFGCLDLKGKLRFSSFKANAKQSTVMKVVPSLQTPYRDYPKEGQVGYIKGQGNERLYYAAFKGINGTEAGNLKKADFFSLKRKPGMQLTRRFYGRKLYKHSRDLEESKNRHDADGNTYECLPVGAKLSGEIIFEGLTREELSALVFALGIGWEKPIYHKLGYAKPAYFGSVKIDVSPRATNGNTRLFGQLLPDIQALGAEYRRNADAELLPAIQAIETYWSDLNGLNQWQPIEGRRIY